MNHLHRVILTSMVAMVCSGKSVSAQDQNQSKNDYELGKSIEIVSNIMRDASIFYVDTVSSEKMLEKAAQGMLQQLDPYTEYIPQSKMDDFEAITSGRYGGIGSTVRRKGEWVEISEPYKNSPADKAGLRPGDLIIAIDGESMQNLDVSKVSSKLRGKPGSKFEITVRPIADTLTTNTVVVKRENVVIPAVSYYGLVEPNIGYIRLESFSSFAASEFKSAMENMSSESSNKMDGIILDLRGNGGGLVDEAVKILSLFLPKGSDVVEIKGKVKVYDSSHKTQTAPIFPDIRIAVLISSASASASEIVAGTIQDLDRGVVLGGRSFGKGLVQVTRNVGYNSFIKLTTAKYYIPSGRSIQAVDYTHRKADGSVGLIPDSLMKEYKTRNGRSVFDGGGIMPDIKIESEYLSKFTTLLYALGYFEDFANRFVVENPIADENFEVSDEIYNNFSKFVISKPLDWESPTKIKLRELEATAEREKYSDLINDEIREIYNKITDDSSRELITFAPEIRRILGSTIMSRWFYDQGRIKWEIKYDNEVIKAIDILSDIKEYEQILATDHVRQNPSNNEK